MVAFPVPEVQLALETWALGGALRCVLSWPAHSWLSVNISSACGQGLQEGLEKDHFHTIEAGPCGLTPSTLPWVPTAAAWRHWADGEVRSSFHISSVPLLGLDPQGQIEGTLPGGTPGTRSPVGSAMKAGGISISPESLVSSIWVPDRALSPGTLGPPGPSLAVLPRTAKAPRSRAVLLH